MAISNPNGLDPTYFQNAANAFKQAQSAALPSPESRDKAAGRLRASISDQTASLNRSLQDQFANQGKIGGQFNNAFLRNTAAGQQAYAQGLAQLEDDYQQQRQAGAGILNQTGAGYGNLADLFNNYGLEQQKLAQEADIEANRLALEQELGQGRLTLDELLGNLDSETKKYGIDQVANSEDFRNKVALAQLLANGGLTTGPTNDRGELFNSQFQGLLSDLLGGDFNVGQLDYSSWLSNNTARPIVTGGSA